MESKSQQFNSFDLLINMKLFILIFCCLGASFALKANCVFDGTVGASQVVGEVTLVETETPDGTEIE